MALIDIDSARSLVLERVRATEPEDVPLRAACERRLVTAVTAAVDVPGFDNSAMDGYAVRAADTAGAAPDSPRELRLAAESRAGHPAAMAAGAGEAIAISTGAMVPAGADAVVRVEDTERRGDVVAVAAAVAAGACIRRRGEDIRSGDELLTAGTALGAAELGALAAAGIAVVRCAARPRVAVLLTGDELVEPDRELGPGQIHDSNAYAVPPLATATGAEVGFVEVIGDDRETTAMAIERGLRDDALVVCGGVSVGEHDHVRPALESLGVEQVFWGVSLRPGKPTYFGVARSGALVFGLPGNPVSAMVTFLLFVRPALLAMQGADPGNRSLTARLTSPYTKVRGRAEAIRVRVEAGVSGWEITPTGPQGSHVLTSMLGADGLAFAAADVVELAAGTELPVELLR
ncbi:MAG TPA: gephyrin-like molybdotransferase Glp [Solirubrobacterales bacterium]|jgi:molybdopterin molybdotransferase|nr:gephyrin-like molybdotransferase Glp [Solirubrobacterales bacterium]